MPHRLLPFPSLVVGSLNDPYMPFDRLKSLSEKWGSHLIDLGHAGHINVASGFGRWSHGYELLKLLNSTKGLKPQATATMKSAESRSVVDADIRKTLPHPPSSRTDGEKSSNPRLNARTLADIPLAIRPVLVDTPPNAHSLQMPAGW